MRFLLLFLFTFIMISCDQNEIVTTNNNNVTNSNSTLSESELKRVIVDYVLNENGDTVLTNVTNELREDFMQFVTNDEIPRDSLFYIRNRRTLNAYLPVNLSFAMFDHTSPTVGSYLCRGSERAFEEPLEICVRILIDNEMWVSMPEENSEIISVEDKGVHFLEMGWSEEVFNQPASSELRSDSLHVYWLSGEASGMFYKHSDPSTTKEFTISYSKFPFLKPTN